MTFMYRKVHRKGNSLHGDNLTTVRVLACMRFVTQTWVHMLMIIGYIVDNCSPAWMFQGATAIAVYNNFQNN